MKLEPQSAFEGLLAELRPRLHRYCARMTGSVIDGEDVVQEAMAKAIEAFPRAGDLERPEAWLFRIAHNAALDHLRRRGRRQEVDDPGDFEGLADPADPVAQRQAAAASLATFMRLPPGPRASVVLADVLGHSLEETAQILETTLPTIKAALHRGRARLRRLAAEPEAVAPPRMDAAERERLAAYVARFNSRDFDALRALLADDARLDLVARAQMRGRAQVSTYFTRYAEARDWQVELGRVEGRLAMLFRDPTDLQGPIWNFAVLTWVGDRVATIRDFRFAPYGLEGAEIVPEPAI